MSGYEGPIRAGMRFVWEPNKPDVRQRVEVTRVETNADRETWVFTRELDGKVRGEYANEEDRFRDACIPITEPYFERWLVLPVIEPQDEVPGSASWRDGRPRMDTFVRLLADVAERNGASRGLAEEIGRQVLGSVSPSEAPSAESMRELCHRAAVLALSALEVARVPQGPRE